MRHEAKIIKLKNGSELLLVKVPNSSVAGFSVSVRAGKNYSPGAKGELAHLVEHMMFAANEVFPVQDDLSYEFEKNGTYYNARTRSNSIDFSYIFGKEFAEKAITLALTQIRLPIFKEDDLENEKSIIRRELEPLIDDPYRPCLNNLAAMISEEVYTPIERLASLDKTTLDDVKDYYKKYFVAKNTKYVLFGSFSNQEELILKGIIEKEMEHYPSGKSQRLIYPKLKDYRKKVMAVDSARAERFCLDLSFVNEEYDTSIFPAMKVFYALYNDGTYSRMFREVRNRGIGYGFNSGYSFNEHYSEFFFSDKSPSEQSLQIFETALTELHSLLNGEFDDKELARAKGYVIGSLERGHRTAEDLARWYAGSFINDEKLDGFNEYIQSVRGLTREEVVVAAQKFVKVDNWALSLLGPGMKKRASSYEKVLKRNRSLVSGIK